MALVGLTCIALLCFLVLQARSQTSEPTTTDACSNINPQQDVNIQQLGGRWYLAEAHTDFSTSHNTSLCYAVEFGVLNSTYLSVETQLPSNSPLFLVIPDQSRPWYLTPHGMNFTITIVHQSTQSLIMARCHPGKNFSVLTKTLPLSDAERATIQQAVINGQLSTVGNGTWISEATCH